MIVVVDCEGASAAIQEANRTFPAEDSGTAKPTKPAVLLERYGSGS